ncbi:MAG: VCBS repeat-containing protein, partial [Bacteroidetes bacterium]|nr:VCBS repeat-containing protein [Bacteroidota bacterium]
MFRSLTSIVCTLLLAVACTDHIPRRPDTLFSLLPADSTGITFANNLRFSEEFNMYTFRNFYNGGGVGVGDINNDGLPDIFFCSNQGSNKLYLNKGHFRFEDITDRAGVASDGVWSTGVVFADVNGDGLLDIYVCKSGDLKGKHRANQLFINNGNLTFTDRAAEYGLANMGLSTHAVFFDYDRDGDLDCYLLNNSFRSVGNFDLVKDQRNIVDSLGGNKLYRNDGGHFTDVTQQAGIYSSRIGFGLGVTIADVNKDGWPDIYVSNDFFEKDYLYINRHDGTFKEDLEGCINEISMNSMGADIADINNDGLPDIYVTDMLPEAEDRIKTKTSFETWDKYQADKAAGYYKQFVRNVLQLNRGPEPDQSPAHPEAPTHSGPPTHFSEISRLAGVQATDWSWGALITDLDNDGNKDIFVANGIYKDLTDQDYIQYMANPTEVRRLISEGKGVISKLVNMIPSTPLPNYAFHNNGDLHFTNMAREWGLDQPGFSNGSAYVDLDNDGNLDLVVNNVNMPAFVYRNNGVPGNHWLKLVLHGEAGNRFAIGAKATIYYGGKLAYQEEMPTRGFESAVDSRLNFGLGKTTNIDSLIVQWPSGKQTKLKNLTPNQIITLNEKDATPATPTIPATPAISVTPTTPVTAATATTTPVTPVTTPTPTSPITAATTPIPTTTLPHPLFTPTTGLSFLHRENEFNDFNRDHLLFSMLSTSGPRMAIADINGDGLDDVYICGARGQDKGLYLQHPNGQFTRQPLPDGDKECEDVDALFFDADGDGDKDLFVCSGGNEFSPNSTALISRLYSNDGHGKFTKSPQLLPSAAVFESTSCVTAADFDGDGDLDLFVGVRLKPFSYGFPCKGYILGNDGHGKFTDITSQVCPALEKLGMITDARWCDYDNDGKPDLIVVGEYMPVSVFHNEGGSTTNPTPTPRTPPTTSTHLKEVTTTLGLSKTNGWWNRLIITDLNGDGYPDLIVGNHGLNSRFKATEQKPVTCYAADFDGNGTVEQIICCYNGDKQYPMALRHDLVSTLPYLKKKYLHYEDYKGQTVEDIFTKDQLDKAIKLDAYELQTCVFLSDGKGHYSKRPLPTEAQFSPVYGLEAGDYDHDGKTDLLLGGNFYQSKPETGIYDASYGLFLKGDGKGGFTPLSPQQSGFFVQGAVRDIRT